MGTGEFNTGGNPVMPGGSGNIPHKDKLRPNEPLGSYADLTMFIELIRLIFE